MPNVPIEFLRGVLGVLCVFFAHMAGRSAAAVRMGRQRRPRLYSWILRTVLCAVFVVFRHEIDATAILVWALAAAAFALGLWLASRQKPEEDLTHEIFPH
ncbi:MAG TPA: hypothetical protein VKX45_15725 [Bryobacteraceae bacterium]|jgi:4-hydroxybenzoate polyprenyltransferase|nr:hypothetical protein [Bryobacteraceae bacterium]